MLGDKLPPAIDSADEQRLPARLLDSPDVRYVRVLQPRPALELERRPALATLSFSWQCVSLADKSLQLADCKHRLMLPFEMTIRKLRVA
ncbi:hypothetical protein F442_14494 [Phytophthora nicotianae P10297]|uniref:Uncharacterized protein n=4 Tax=Phytophthora nicotianae TaxID=4792 RepID=V9EKK0_PHYNI|nr:hypothetical protein F443_14674 [Phytophthora nicotianae P1569]ETL86597.1 hypothetical protein L917_13992 [Phytophthora nicotianae]ETM39762.1 hypothetical protein L914_14118 [Phytophthora nicotianae]ETO68490.1 hypothetical protein F444_14680 [Phytophthora nicotianae P1976]ETP37723.1 hypothetical protein F442_14494 [Phytophthora nicotianae P10297]